MLRVFYIYLLLCCSFSTVHAQEGYERDTSFSIAGTYKSEVKSRPYISIVKPVADKTVAVQQDIVYRVLGERQLQADIYYPKNTAKPKPAVMLIFGGGWRSGDRMHNHAMASYLAKNGYVAVSPEYRLSLEAKYPAAVNDLKAAIKWMKEHATTYGIDTSKIAVLGCSAGGELAAFMGTTGNKKRFEDGLDCQHSAAVQAVVDIDGSLQFFHPDGVEGTASVSWVGYDYQENPAIWAQASPITHVDAATPPFLFLNSSLPRFHAGRDDMIVKMDSLGIYHETHTFPDTPHTFWFFKP